MTILAALSLFFTTPAPLDLPRAEAFLVKEGATHRLEDRYWAADLWQAHAVVGRWFDDDRTFILSRLDVLPPSLADEQPLTREDFEQSRVSANPKEPRHLARMIAALSPVDIVPKPVSPRQMPRGYRDVRYWQGTNTTAIVCAFWPEKEAHWYLATWELKPGDAWDEMCDAFTREFLDARAWKDVVANPPVSTASERELLRRDVRHGVAAYAGWHATDSTDFIIVDDLATRDFVASLTNDMPRWRGRFAAVLPTPIDGTNVLAVARIYRDRDDYLDAAGEDMAWSAAYWSPQRRELVAYLPADGTETLRRTIHHEAFHQYLSYALAMLPASPWLNEGYAQYFEDEDAMDWGFLVSPNDVDRFATMLPALLQLDYKQFYAGDDAGRRLKYRLAWSVAVFIEKGAPKVRFEPFKNLKRDYAAAILKTQDMCEATDAAFGSADRLAQFVTEWKRFWKNH